MSDQDLPTGRMTDDEVSRFLHESRNAVVATIRKDGSCQLSPTWYTYEEGIVYIFITADSVKYRNLKRDPRISICVDGGHPDGRAVMIYGVAEIVETLDDWHKELDFRNTRRYIDGDEEAREYNAEAQAWGPWVVAVVKPVRIVGVDSS